MSPHKDPNIIKYCVITSTTALILIVISLLPIFIRAMNWNRCFNQTISWINEKEKELSGLDISAKQALLVRVCNGAVYQPRFKKK